MMACRALPWSVIPNSFAILIKLHVGRMCLIPQAAKLRALQIGNSRHRLVISSRGMPVIAAVRSIIC